MKKQFGKVLNQSFAEKLKTVYPNIVRCDVKLIRGDGAIALFDDSPDFGRGYCNSLQKGDVRTWTFWER